MKKSFWKRYVAYLNDNPEGYWFKRKPYGWGWTPATKEGFIVTGGYVAVVLFLAFNPDLENATGEEVFFSLFLPLIILTALFIRITYKRGERPEWMWGEEMRDISARPSEEFSEQSKRK